MGVVADTMEIHSVSRETVGITGVAGLADTSDTFLGILRGSCFAGEVAAHNYGGEHY